MLTVTYSAGVNNTGSARSSTIHIAGSDFSVTQLSGQQASLSIAKTHAGNFTQGQIGATYSVTVRNAAGAASTSGTVTVTENLPLGLTLVSMSGTGWTCPGTAANNCTRSDVLAAGASYPAITVTVNVASNAGSPLQNSVTVSGGGSSDSSAIDSTVINAGAPQALRFVPVTPCRIADTRNANGPFGGPQSGRRISRDFNVPVASSCGIPANALAYSLNLTVVPLAPPRVHLGLACRSTTACCLDAEFLRRPNQGQRRHRARRPEWGLHGVCHRPHSCRSSISTAILFPRAAHRTWRSTR